MDGQRADSIILLNGFLPFQPGKRAVADYPMVVVSERIAGVDAPIVGIDNVAAAFDAVSYLARLGHRRVAYICGPGDNVLTGERREGYEKAVEAYDLERWPEAVQPGEFSIRAGREATARLLAASPRPTAVFTANDEMQSARSWKRRRTACGFPRNCRSSASTISKWDKSAIRR